MDVTFSTWSSMLHWTTRIVIDEQLQRWFPFIPIYFHLFPFVLSIYFSFVAIESNYSCFMGGLCLSFSVHLSICLSIWLAGWMAVSFSFLLSVLFLPRPVLVLTRLSCLRVPIDLVFRFHSIQRFNYFHHSTPRFDQPWLTNYFIYFSLTWRAGSIISVNRLLSLKSRTCLWIASPFVSLIWMARSNHHLSSASLLPLSLPVVRLTYQVGLFNWRRNIEAILSRDPSGPHPTAERATWLSHDSSSTSRNKSKKETDVAARRRRRSRRTKKKKRGGREGRGEKSRSKVVRFGTISAGKSRCFHFCFVYCYCCCCFCCCCCCCCCCCYLHVGDINNGTGPINNHLPEEPL